MHLQRSGGNPADISAVPASMVKAAQLCDGPATPPPDQAGLIAEAREDRLPPGEGGLPLLDFLRALPPGTAISAEVPMPKLDAATKLARAYAATRQMLVEVGLTS